MEVKPSRHLPALAPCVNTPLCQSSHTPDFKALKLPRHTVFKKEETEVQTVNMLFSSFESNTLWGLTCFSSQPQVAIKGTAALSDLEVAAWFSIGRTIVK